MPIDPLTARKRADQPSALDRKYGLVRPQRRPVPRRHDLRGPGNAKANPTRSYAYTTAADVFFDRNN